MGWSEMCAARQTWANVDMTLQMSVVQHEKMWRVRGVLFTPPPWSSWPTRTSQCSQILPQSSNVFRNMHAQHLNHASSGSLNQLGRLWNATISVHTYPRVWSVVIIWTEMPVGTNLTRCAEWDTCAKSHFSIHSSYQKRTSFNGERAHSLTLRLWCVSFSRFLQQRLSTFRQLMARCVFHCFTPTPLHFSSVTTCSRPFAAHWASTPTPVSCASASISPVRAVALKASQAFVKGQPTNAQTHIMDDMKMEWNAHTDTLGGFSWGMQCEMHVI